MLADLVQTFGVVLVVVAAVGYLLLTVRRTWRQGGGCGCCGTKGLPFTVETRPAEPDGDVARTDRVPTKQVITLDRLTESARACAARLKNDSDMPPGQSS